MHRTLPLLALASLFATSSNARAGTGGWDWDEEVAERVWNDDSVGWAADLHPTHPPERVLEAFVEPPPRELWCVYVARPSERDCDEHAARLEAWAQNYLGRSVRAEELGFPPECSSPCYP